jgi:hypothetical protein
MTTVALKTRRLTGHPKPDPDFKLRGMVKSFIGKGTHVALEFLNQLGKEHYR